MKHLLMRSFPAFLAVMCLSSVSRAQSPHTMPDSRVSLFADQLAALPETDRPFAVSGFLQAIPQSPLIESDTVASIFYYGQAQQVLVNGDLQDGWSRPDTMYRVKCGSGSFFYISYLLPPDTRVDYQLIIDGQYLTDPRNPKVTPSGYGPHSELAMPAFHPCPARARFPGIPRGTLDSLQFTSKSKGIAPRKIKVYLPAGYENMKELPVLYVMDGLEALEWMDYPNVLDNLIAGSRIRPVIGVFIPPGDRGGETMGRSRDDFLEALCGEIVPMIDERYPTDADPSGRAVTGISAGGYFALYAVLKKYSVIACGAGQSPAIDARIYQAAARLAKKKKAVQDLRIYFDMGQYDLPLGVLDDKTFVQASRDLSGEMEILGLSHVYREVNDGHEWANWRERTGEILQYFFPLGK